MKHSVRIEKGRVHTTLGRATFDFPDEPRWWAVWRATVEAIPGAFKEFVPPHWTQGGDDRDERATRRRGAAQHDPRGSRASSEPQRRLSVVAEPRPEPPTEPTRPSP